MLGTAEALAFCYNCSTVNHEDRDVIQRFAISIELCKGGTLVHLGQNFRVNFIG